MFSNDTKVDDFVTLTVTFSLKIAFSDFIATIYLVVLVCIFYSCIATFWNSTLVMHYFKLSCSEVTTKEVISLLLKKFHILDNPRKFALYEQELSLKGKIGWFRPQWFFPLEKNCTIVNYLWTVLANLMFIILVWYENKDIAIFIWDFWGANLI